MYNCNSSCRLCNKLAISDSVTVVTVNGVDTLVIDIPSACYRDCEKVCIVVAQSIPTTATINMPVAISIGGVTTTVYPVVRCDCTQVTACAIRTRTKYAFRVNTTATGAVFKSLGGLCCAPNNVLSSIPVATTPTPATASDTTEQVAVQTKTQAAKRATKSSDVIE